MAKKRGIIVTIAILAVITGVSFSTWLIPQKEDASFVVSDFKDHLESIQARQKVIADEIETDFQAMRAGTVIQDDFIIRAKASTSQINALIIELVESKAPKEWHESYLNYGESLKSYNSYLLETIVLANKIKEDSSSDIKENLERLDVLKKESESFGLKSNETRP
ncbi:MAG TPA: hypothetical protein HA319_02880 [Nitrosopumilaceae archaeon]|nr:hypothetical protein [Nitrosopumilaceae archaeon]